MWLGTTLAAQEDLTVIVLGIADEPVEQVTVTLQNPAHGFTRSVPTGKDGRAVFRSLAAVDGYLVGIPAFFPYREYQSGGLNLRAKQEQSLVVVLQEDTLRLSGVVVRSGALSTGINLTDAEVSFSLGRDELEALPVEGRDLTRALYRLPNVAQATGFFPEAPNVSINGANPLFTSYLVDGMDNNERFLGGQKFAVPLGFAKDVTVLTNNYSAEYGLTNNGVVNITTRSGINDFEGEAYVVHRPGPALDAKSPFPQRDLSGNAVRDGFRRHQAGVALGGPLKKDKTFFYLDLEHTTDVKDNRLSSPALRVEETVRGENRFSYFSGKIDHIWSDRFRSSFRANIGVVGIERQGGGLEGGVAFPSAANVQDRNSVLLAARNTWFRGNFSSETNVQYARFRWNYARAASEGSPQVVVLDPQEQPMAILGHPGYAFDQTENTLQFQHKSKWYLPRHTIKAGGGLISARHSLVGGGNESGNYTVRLDAQQLETLASAGHGRALGIADLPADVAVLRYEVELRPASFGQFQHIASVFVEDRFTASDRLTLTVGLRYDYDNLSKGGALRGDLNNIAPRFNANYRLGRAGVLRGGYGIFYDKILYAVHSDALQQNTTATDYRRQLQRLKELGMLPAGTDIDRITYDGNLSASLSQVPYLQGPDYTALQGRREGVFRNEGRILNPNGYENPLTHQFAIGYQRQLDVRRHFYIDLVHNRSEHLFRLRNLNAPAAYPLPDADRATARTPADADASRLIPILGGGFAVIDGDTLYGVARNVVVSETAGQSRYHAASINLQQVRSEGSFAWRVNYTLSLLENNTEDINFRAMDSNDFEAEWGPGINDRRHLLNGILTWYPTERLGITATALLQGGQPVNRIPDALRYGTTDLNGDGASFGDAYVGNSDRHPGEHRNSDRLPGARSVDLSLQYEVAWGVGSLVFRADVFNVFNTTNLSGFSNHATQSNQIQVGPAGSGIVRKNAGPPRQFQFSVTYLL